MSNDTNVVLKVPEEMIKAQVQAAIVESLSKNGTQLVAQLVQSALSERSDNYGRQTKWETMVNKLITEVARDVLIEWVESHRDEIRTRMFDALNRRPKERVKSIVDSVVDAFGKSLNVHVRIDTEL